jgi:hypothetical protein
MEVQRDCGSLLLTYLGMCRRMEGFWNFHMPIEMHPSPYFL